MIPLLLTSEPTVGLSGINWNTIILSFFSLLGTSVTAIVAAYVVKSKKLQEEAKEDVKAVKQDLAISTSETMSAMEGQSKQLTVIHALNNSALTASMKSTLDSKLLNVTFMEEIIAGLGRPASESTLETLSKAKGQVEELQKAIDERERQQDMINQKIVEGQKSGPIDVRVANTVKEAVPVKPSTGPTSPPPV